MIEVVVVVLLKIKDAVLFEEFESKAIAIMKNHGGSLQSAFTPSTELSSSNAYDEVHCLKFPDVESFNAYRSDPALLALADLRAKAISDTQVFVSSQSRNY